MSEAARSLTDALPFAREVLVGATIPRWRHGQSAFMDQPNHVLVRPRGRRLSMVVAVATQPGPALTISRLRDFVPIFASFLHSATLVHSVDGSLSGDDVLGLWSHSWQHSSTRWIWAGWDPDTRSPQVPDPSMGRFDTWTVGVADSPARPVPSSGSRELVVPRDTVAKGPEHAWQLTDDTTGSRRRICDTHGTTIADFSREEDALFIVTARHLMPTLGGAAEALLEHAGNTRDGSFSPADIRGIVDSAPPWHGVQAQPPAAPGR